MIAMSDAVIILVSASALTAGLYRWQNSMDQTVMVRTTPTYNTGTNQPDVPRAQVASTVERGAAGVASGNVLVATENSSVSTAAAPAANTQSNATSQSPAASEQASNTTSPLYGVHNVRSGDSLSVIAQRYGSTVSTLREINGISGSLIQIGQEIRYPLPAN